VLGTVIFLRDQHGVALIWHGLVPGPPYLKRAFFLVLLGSLELSTRAFGLVRWPGSGGHSLPRTSRSR
jgi:hypothetical protein